MSWATPDGERIGLRDDQGSVLLVRDLDNELGYSARRLRVRWGGAHIKDRCTYGDADHVEFDVAAAHVRLRLGIGADLIAVYLFARERNDHNVWTSPLFPTFAPEV